MIHLLSLYLCFSFDFLLFSLSLVPQNDTLIWENCVLTTWSFWHLFYHFLFSLICFSCIKHALAICFYCFPWMFYFVLHLHGRIFQTNITFSLICLFFNETKWFNTVFFVVFLVVMFVRFFLAPIAWLSAGSAPRGGIREPWKAPPPKKWVNLPPLPSPLHNLIWK